MDFVAFEPKSPEEIFPLEVWGMILNSLDSPSDLSNCYQTCRSWAKLLLHKRTSFLMPQVYPLLNKYLASELDKEDGSYHEKVLSATLNIRMISRTWKQSVDSYYQNHRSISDIGFFKRGPLVPPETFPLHSYTFYMATVDNWESFLDKNIPLDTNIFIGRHVTFIDEYCVGERHTQRRVRSCFKNILKSYGSQICSCALRFEASEKVAKLYQLVHRYISLMPNLRCLSLKFIGKQKKSSTTELAGLIQDQPFPKLELLDKIRLFGNVPSVVSIGILGFNSDVSKVSMIRGGIKGPEVVLSDPIVKVHTNIEQLAFLTRSKADLVNLRKLTWPLKVLHISVKEGKLSQVFKAVSTFSNSLEELFIVQSSPAVDNCKLQEFKLNLPKLQKLTLEVYKELTTIDFLVGCTALLDLYLEMNGEISMEESTSSCSESENDNGVRSNIKFNGYETIMHKSNIWQLLPMLQVVTIKKEGITLMNNITNKKVTIFDMNSRFTKRQFEKYCFKHQAAQE